jgi:broad specificity phosphatase PhoE
MMRAFAFAIFAAGAFIACNDSGTSSTDTQSTEIESSAADLDISDSDKLFGGSSAQGSPEGPVATTSSSALPATFSSGQYDPPHASPAESSSSVEPFPESSCSAESSSSAPRVAAEIPLDKDGFATVADVYRSLAPDEKAVIIIRHSEREDDVALETELTANGIQMAQDLGATLRSDEEFTYVTSGFVRTNETANHISKGRREATLPKLTTNYDITGNWFLKISADSLAKHATALGLNGSSVELMARWAYEGGYPEAFYELEPRAQEFMQTVIRKNLSKWKRVTIMVSHDIFVMPLAVFGSQKKVALKYHEDYHWINYIAGLAVIADAQNNLRYIPVKGAESGVIDYLALYMAEHKVYTR